MAFPVIDYLLQISTVPPPGSAVAEFIPRVSVTVRTNAGTQNMQLPIKSPAEFMAVCALIQTPGNLLYDPTQATLEKLLS